MRAGGTYSGVTFTARGNPLLTFELEKGQITDADLEQIKEKKLVITAEVFRDPRSDRANRYFWQLCDKIAKSPHIKSDKWTIYLLLLNKYGVFQDVRVRHDAIPTFQDMFRYVEELDSDGEFSDLRVYKGSSHYNTKEMSDLINGTVEDAKELGIETATPDEIEAMINAWKGAGYAGT